LGVIYLDNRHRQDAFSEVDLRVLQAYGDQAAVAVMNARLIEENLRRTKDLLEANRKMEVLNAKLRHRVIVKNAQLALAKEDLKERQSQLEERYRFRNIVGRSEAMRRIFFMLERVAATPLPVLLEGESGTGKELIAHAIHFSSPQREARFVSLNCGALTESLLESELFGHTRGSFTGAIMDKKGLFELADNGTLFLDEVGDMSLAMQQKILRVLQEGEIRRVGGKDSIRVSVRVVSASNRSMKELVRSGAFREDLYYRLNGITLHVPSLRERKEDIPYLVEHFCQLSGKPDEPPRKFLPDALRALMEHDWPGNVRELRHVIDRSMLIASDLTIGAADLLIDAPTEPADAPPSLAPTPIRALPEAGRGGRAAFSLKEARSQAERELLTKSLDAVGGSVAAAARRCGISRESFYRLLRRHGIQPR
jgi:transcriptional regulator with GAF, ATPase, and Fis domain